MKTVNLELKLRLNRVPTRKETKEIGDEVERLLRSVHLYEHYFGKGKLLAVRGHKVTFKVKRKPKMVVHNPCTCGVCKLAAL